MRDDSKDSEDNEADNAPKFRMQTKESQKKVATCEYTVICLMVILAATSIIWSVSIHILSGDFYHGILGAKLAFRERDFRQMDERSKQLFYQELGNLINETYTNAALLEENDAAANASDEADVTTKKPKIRKIPHLFQTITSLNAAPVDVDDDEPEDMNTTTLVPKVKFNMEQDRKFLATMMVDVHQTRWRQSAAVQFIYSFPFLSEIFAIIWTAMCLIFQSGVKKYWGLPKPWRIVVPSILVFTLMSLGTLIYTILANSYLKNLCTGLRENLTRPDAISCGQAISVLRPFIRQHEFRHDVYLNLFRVSYMLSLVLWVLALLLMVLRYAFAIDFQLIDVQSLYESKLPQSVRRRDPEFTEVLLSPPPPPPPTTYNATQLLPIGERHKSEDDFQSAKSHLSEVSTPLLNAATQTKVV